MTAEPRPARPDASAARKSPSILPLRVEGATFAAGGRKLVDGLSFELSAGPCTVVLGPNGAGKSVTLRLCHGLLQPTAGTVRWCGPDAGAAPRHQAMVFQRPVLLRRSALGNVEYALGLRGVPRGARRARALEALRRVGLEGLAGAPARAMSGGEQQRLALARAWALEPAVLFLDEPTASLDPAATLAVEAIVRAILETGKKIVMTTHNLGQARRLADEVLYLHRGRLLECTRAAEFFDRPKSAEARAYLKGEICP